MMTIFLIALAAMGTLFLLLAAIGSFPEESGGGSLAGSVTSLKLVLGFSSLPITGASLLVLGNAKFFGKLSGQ